MPDSFPDFGRDRSTLASLGSITRTRQGQFHSLRNAVRARVAEHLFHLPRGPSPGMSPDLASDPVPVRQISPFESGLHRFGRPPRDGSLGGNRQVAECECHSRYTSASSISAASWRHTAFTSPQSAQPITRFRYSSSCLVTEASFGRGSAS